MHRAIRPTRWHRGGCDVDVQRFLCFRMAGGADPQFIVSRPEPGIAYDAFRCGRPCLFEAVQLVFIQALHVLVDGALRQEAERQVVLMCCQADFMGKGHGLLQDVAIVSWHYGQVVDQQGRKVRREQAALLKFLQWEECDPLRVAHIHQPAVGEQPAAVYHGGPGRAAFQFERPGLIFSGRKTRKCLHPPAPAAWCCPPDGRHNNSCWEGLRLSWGSIAASHLFY